MRLDLEDLRRIVKTALEEDLGERGDITSDSVIPPEANATAHIVARQDLVLAGVPAAREVYRVLDASLGFVVHHGEGEELTAATHVASVRGRTRSILRGERTALNLLMRMCGIATATRAAVQEISGTGARILDTRKTAPGLRSLDKYAVRAGGAVNHRMGLYDAVMLKDTHLRAVPSITAAVRRARAGGQPAEIITVEVNDLEQLDEAIEAGAGRALLDNMSVAMMARAVKLAAGRIVLEASGGLKPGALRGVAETGVAWLSLGWLTHSAPAADLALELEEQS